MEAWMTPRCRKTDRVALIGKAYFDERTREDVMPRSLRLANRETCGIVSLW